MYSSLSKEMKWHLNLVLENKHLDVAVADCAHNAVSLEKKVPGFAELCQVCFTLRTEERRAACRPPALSGSCPRPAAGSAYCDRAAYEPGHKHRAHPRTHAHTGTEKGPLSVGPPICFSSISWG